jgi:hypothetical protein
MFRAELSGCLTNQPTKQERDLEPCHTSQTCNLRSQAPGQALGKRTKRGTCRPSATMSAAAWPHWPSLCRPCSPMAHVACTVALPTPLAPSLSRINPVVFPIQ